MQAWLSKKTAVESSQWRRAADRFRSSETEVSAIDRPPLPESRKATGTSLLGLLSSFLNHRSNSIQLLLRKPGSFQSKQGINDVLHRSVVERVNELPERVSSNLPFLYRRRV